MAKPFITADEALHYLKAAGQSDDRDIDLVECAFAFSLLDTPDRNISGYREYIAKLKETTGEVFEDLCATSNSDDVAVQASTLRQVLINEEVMQPDNVTYDNLRNINLFDVIDRKKGLQISLSILAIGLARAHGWNADGVNFPGHFIMRLEKEGVRVMLDPYNEFKMLEAKDLRVILKNVMGDNAELSSDYYLQCTNREILLRYQNNMKYRLIDAEEYLSALEIVKRMEMIAPNDLRLALDKAVLFARVGQSRAAIEAVTYYIALVENPYDKAEAEAFLYELQKQLN